MYNINLALTSMHYCETRLSLIWEDAMHAFQWVAMFGAFCLGCSFGALLGNWRDRLHDKLDDMAQVKSPQQFLREML